MAITHDLKIRFVIRSILFRIVAAIGAQQDDNSIRIPYIDSTALQIPPVVCGTVTASASVNNCPARATAQKIWLTLQLYVSNTAFTQYAVVAFRQAVTHANNLHARSSLR